jgi:hypothetical protein
MSTNNNLVSGITGILTIGVGGLVAWAKKNLSNLLKQAEAVRTSANSDIKKIEADVANIQAAVNSLASAVNPPKPAKATAKKATAKVTKRTSGR